MIDKEKIIKRLTISKNLTNGLYIVHIDGILNEILRGEFDVPESREESFQRFTLSNIEKRFLSIEKNMEKIEKDILYPRESKNLESEGHSYVLNAIQSLNKRIDDLTETVRDEAIKTYELQHILGKFQEAFDEPTESSPLSFFKNIISLKR